MLEIAGLVATPIFSFVGAWGGVKARLTAMDKRMDGIDKRIDETNDDVREIREKVFQVGPTRHAS